MDLCTFEELVTQLEPLLKKCDTPMRNAISPSEQLAVTLRFLATGESYTSLQYQFRINKGTISQIIPRVCKAISETLSHEFIKCLTSEEEWEQIAHEFWVKWQLPNCLGAIDGKHVRHDFLSTFFCFFLGGGGGLWKISPKVRQDIWVAIKKF